MFDIGFWEIVLVFVVALVVVGPERLPELARTLGIWVNRARRMMNEVRGEVERELKIGELKQSISHPESLPELQQLADRVKTINTGINTGINSDIYPPAAPGDTTTSATPAVGSSPQSPPESSPK